MVTNHARRTVSGSSIGDARTLELKKKLVRRLTDEGYDSVREFLRKTRVPFSLETIRRAFNECDYKNIESSTLAIVLKYLNYTHNEIKHILTEYTDDKELVQLIGDTGEQYDMYEQRLVQAYRVIIKAAPDMGPVLADQLDLIGRVARVDTAGITDILRRY